MGAGSPYTDGAARLAVAQFLVSGPPNLTVDGYRNMQCDAAGNLCVNIKAGGGSGGGAEVVIGDPQTATNQVAVLAPGGNGAYAMSVQGVLGGTPMPVSGTFTTTGTVTANAGTGFPTASSPGTPGTQLTTIQGSPSGTAVPVSGVFYQATQPVSLVTLPALTTGSASIGLVGIAQGGNTAVVSTPLATGNSTSPGVSVNAQLEIYNGTTWDALRGTAGAMNVLLGAGANTIGSVNVLGGNTTAVKVDGSAVTQPVSGTITANLQVGGVALSATNPAPMTAGQFARTDKSGTITAGGTAQDVFAAAAAIHGFYFQNISTINMWIRDDGTAASAGAGSILVPANGGYYESPPLSTPTSKLSVFCATTASAFTSKVW
jgi:hypothetical protein